MEILQNANNKDLFIPELDEERKLKTADPVASDLLGALLSVSWDAKEVSYIVVLPYDYFAGFLPIIGGCLGISNR